MKRLIKQHNFSWFKAYILITALVCAAFLGVKVFVQAQSAPTAPVFCSKTDAVSITTSQVINCGSGYHIEGTACAANTAGYKHWIGNISNGFMFSTCGNGALDSGETCDGAAGVATSPSGSLVTKQYACTTDCQPTGGYLGDGIVQTVYGEACDTNLSVNKKTCTTTASTLCGAVDVEGTQTCNLSGQWGACVGIDPVEGSNESATLCESLTVDETAACCVLTSCTNDQCGCCGWSPGAFTKDPPVTGSIVYPYIDLEQTLTNNGYTPKNSIGPCHDGSGADIPCQCYLSSGGPGWCTCGTANCSSTYYEHPAGDWTVNPGVATSRCNVNYNKACVIGKSTANDRNWRIMSNHATAGYKCWK